MAAHQLRETRVGEHVAAVAEFQTLTHKPYAGLATSVPAHQLREARVGEHVAAVAEVQNPNT